MNKHEKELYQNSMFFWWIQICRAKIECVPLDLSNADSVLPTRLVAVKIFVFLLQAWCYTHTNGASLVRMAEMFTESELADYVGKWVNLFSL